MATSSEDSMEGSPPKTNVPPSLAPLNFYTLMDQMVGENKKRFTDVVVPNVGIPTPPRPEMEIRVANFFESCAFKTGISCVAGEYVMIMKQFCMSCRLDFTGL